jgi:hypothetical protein
VRAPSIPPPPAAPDPFRVAAAQTSSNVTTAIANAYLANADEDRPDGAVRFTKITDVAVEDPQYGSTGNQVGTTTRLIPRFKRTVTLSAKSQILYDQQQETSEELNALALNLAKQINTKTSTSFNLDGLPDRASTPSAPEINSVAPVRGSLITTIGSNDYEAEKQRVSDAINDRLQYQITLDRLHRITELEQRGLYAGSTAYEREMRTFDLQSNDARVQAYLAASTEHQRLIELEATKARFANEVQDTDLKQRLLLLEWPSAQNTKRFIALMQLAEFMGTLRHQAIQERVLSRGQTMNEISTLLHGTRVEIPTFSNFKSQPISDTPVGQYVYQSEAIKNQQWQFQANMQQQQHQQRQAQIGQIVGAVGGIAAGAAFGGGFGAGGKNSMLSSIMGGG